MIVRRGFIDQGDGQVHYRQAGAGPVLLALHAAPGSSRQLVPLIERMAASRRVIAPDMPGHGDSSPLADAAPTIADYAARLPLLLDAMGIGTVDVYGSHTGAAIAVELALLAPARVGGLVIDGIGLFPEAQRQDLLAHYAAPFPPDLDGAYLQRAFHFLRDQYLFFPWYARSPEARREGGLAPPGDLHVWLVELLKAAETYHLAYRAAFSWDAAGRLPLLRHKALLIAAANDPLVENTRQAAALLPATALRILPRTGDADFAATRAAVIEAHLEGTKLQ